MPTIIVPEDARDTRIDAALSAQLGIPRSRAARFLKEGRVLLDGAKVKASHRCQPGETFDYPEELLEEPVIQKDPAPDLHVLYEDDGVLVIEKPAGLLVHPTGPEDGSATVADGLVKRCPAAAHVGDDPSRPGIVHRLDRDVSGVMVLAKTQEAFEALKHQFQDRTVEKEYLALAYGTLPKDHAEITLRIARSKAKGFMVARPEGQEGREAITLYDTIQRYATATYARVRILTGRTHQIRVHFKAIGHPIVGDKLYGRNIPAGINPIRMDRLFLHAHRLSFETLDGERRTFESPLPKPLEDLLRTLPTL